MYRLLEQHPFAVFYIPVSCISSFRIREKNLPVGEYFSFIYITNISKHYKMGLTEEHQFRGAFDDLMPTLGVRTTVMY